MSTPNSTPYLATSEVFPEDKSQMLIKMTSVYTDIANRVNLREIALYDENLQLATGQQFSTPGNNKPRRQSFRKTFYFGAIGAGATLSFAHGIAGLVQFTHMHGTCVTAADFRPIPYVPAVAVNYISLNADAVNVNVQNGAIAINSGIIILEYLLN
jgi:hypothetical protein